MYFYFLIYFFFIVFFINFLIKYSMPLMGNIFKEIPNERSSHKKTKLKSGGIFFILMVLISNLIFVFLKGSSEISQIIFICSLLSLIGLADDLFFLSSKIRYLIQIIFSFFIVNTVHPFLIIDQNYITLIALIFLGTVIINFMNFIDGLDGILIGCSIPILIFSQINFFNIQILTAIASMLAFLKWNWDPSKIFMGDCGSNYLGVISSHNSNGNLIIGHGAQGTVGSSGYVSTYGNFEGGHSVFELSKQDHHDHIVCQKCGKISEFSDEKIESRQKEVAESLGYILLDHNLNMYGLCPDCR